MLRCPLCAGLSHTKLYGVVFRCELCSLAFFKDSGSLPSPDSYRVSGTNFDFPNWNNWLSRGTRRLPIGPRKPFYFSVPTVRMFAAKYGVHATFVRHNVPLSVAFIPWLLGQTIQARMETCSPSDKSEPDRRLTLGIIAAGDAAEEVLALCRDLSGHAAEVIVVLDTTDTSHAMKLEKALSAAQPAAGGMRPRVVANPLGSDFAAQRNRIQQASRTEWVLQLDCDETLSERSRICLSSVIDEAEREGWHAVALVRRNMVDGAVSALYPDVQYRLLRRSVRFTRAVHEYPLLRRSQPSFVHLGVSIIHKINSLRLDKREKLYEGIEDGAGRPHDSALLRMALEQDVVLPA